MQYADTCFKPYGTRTSATDATATLVPWDVATVAALKAIPSIQPRDVGATTRATNYMMLPQGREEAPQVDGLGPRRVVVDEVAPVHGLHGLGVERRPELGAGGGAHAAFLPRAVVRGLLGTSTMPGPRCA